MVNPASAKRWPSSLASRYSCESGPHFEPPKIVMIRLVELSVTKSLSLWKQLKMRCQIDYSRVKFVLKWSGLFCFFRRKVTGFVNRSCRVREKQNNTADDEKNDEPQNCVTKRTRRPDDYRKH